MLEEVTLEQHVILFTPPSGELSLIDPRSRYGFRFAKKRREKREIFGVDDDNETSLSGLSDNGILEARSARSYGQLARLTRH